MWIRGCNVRDTLFQFVRISACNRKDTLSQTMRAWACTLADNLLYCTRVPACTFIDPVFKYVRLVANNIKDVTNGALTLTSIEVLYQNSLCELQHFWPCGTTCFLLELISTASTEERKARKKNKTVNIGNQINLMRNRERWNKNENICDKNAKETGVIQKGKSKIFKDGKKN